MINNCGGEYMKELHANIHELLKVTGYTAFHSQGFKGKGQIIAVIDTGIRDTHEAFDGKSIIKGENFFSRKRKDGSKYDSDYVYDDTRNGHGTKVMSCIVGETSRGLLGTAPESTVLAVKVTDESGDGYSDDIVDALEYVRDWRGENGETVDAVNLSFSSNGWPGMHDVIKDLYEMGILVFCSAGNSGKKEYYYPQNYPETIVSGAVKWDMDKASFSTYGNQVDICQLGVNVGVATNSGDDEYSLADGTSFASPISTGLAVLLKQKFEFKFGRKPTADEWKQEIIMNTKDIDMEGKDIYTGHGFFTLQPLVSNKYFTIGSNIMMKNDSSVTMEVPAEIYGGDEGRTMLPVRYCNDDFAVLWLEHSRQVKVIS